MNHRSSRFENVSCWGDVVIAFRDRKTASVTIHVHARPAFARDMVRIMLDDETFWTRISAAMAFLPATLVEVGIGAVPITTKDVCGITPELVISRALEHCTTALLVSTSLQILMSARCVLA